MTNQSGAGQPYLVFAIWFCLAIREISVGMSSTYGLQFDSKQFLQSTKSQTKLTPPVNFVQYIKAGRKQDANISLVRSTEYLPEN